MRIDSKSLSVIRSERWDVKCRSSFTTEVAEEAGFICKELAPQLTFWDLF